MVDGGRATRAELILIMGTRCEKRVLSPFLSWKKLHSRSPQPGPTRPQRSKS